MNVDTDTNLKAQEVASRACGLLAAQLTVAEKRIAHLQSQLRRAADMRRAQRLRAGKRARRIALKMPRRKPWRNEQLRRSRLQPLAESPIE